MTKTFKKLLLLLAVMLMPLGAVAQELYGVYLNDLKRLNIYYDDNKTFWENKNHIEILYPGEWGNIDIQELIFTESVKNARPTSCSGWFMNCLFIENIEHLEYLNTSECTDMSKMFYGCHKLKKIDLSTFSTINVSDISKMFYECVSLDTIDLSSFKNAHLNDMSKTFYNCWKLKEIIGLDELQTYYVTDMSQMFFGCEKLWSIDLNSFEINKSTNLSGMFENCLSLTRVYCNNVWDDKYANAMFHNCPRLCGGNGSRGDELELGPRPDIPGYPGAFTATEGLFFDGYRLGASNTPSWLQYEYDAENHVLTMKDTWLTPDYGFYTPEANSLYVNIIGNNKIHTTKGPAFQVNDLFLCSDSEGSLEIISDENYGILMKGNCMLSGTESTGPFNVNIYGKMGAIRGNEGYDGYLNKKVWPYLSPGDFMRLSLSSDGEHPVIKELASIIYEEDSEYSYDGYHYDSNFKIVVDDNTLDDVGNPVTVTKPFSIVPKGEKIDYPVQVGGKHINNLNSTDFNPMSLKSGNVKYEDGVLTLDNADFGTAYEPTYSDAALYAESNNLQVILKGDNNLVGTLDNIYGISIYEDSSDKTSKREWSIISGNEGSTFPSLKLRGDCYFNSTWGENAELLFKDVNVTVSDDAYFWQEDYVNVTIDNSSLDLKNASNPDQTIMESLPSLTLKGSKFENGCRFDASGCVVNSKGEPATGRVLIVRGDATYKKGDVNHDGKVNTADVVAVYSFIEKGEASGITRDAANVNGDSSVNTADVVAIYDIIIKGSTE